MRTVEPIGPQEAAARLLLWLEAHGAPCALDADGEIQVDLEPIRRRDALKADGMAAAVSYLSEEIAAILRADRIQH